MKKLFLTSCIFVLTLAASHSLFAKNNDVSSRKISIANNPNQTYFLIGESNVKSNNDDKPHGLVIIMPGGDGSADFHPFITNIYRQAIPKNYLAAQPIAVKWTQKQYIVWPTKRDKVKKMKFTTETFVEDVIKDVQSQYDIDPDKIFTFTWSSSGPAAYAIATQKQTAVKGSFIAMSVFKPAKLKSKNAKGHSFYIYHSKQDKVAPYRFAYTAMRRLTKNNANVTLKTYNGGHGWMHANLWKNISDGIKFLDANACETKATKNDQE